MELYFRRCVAYVIDFLLISVVLGIYTISAYVFSMDSQTYNKAAFMMLCSLLSIYYLCGYVPMKTGGQTIGKYITKIQVLNNNGTKRNLWQCFCREFFLKYSLVVMFLPTVCINYALNGLRNKSLRVTLIHDEILNTQVVKVQNERVFHR